MNVIRNLMLNEGIIIMLYDSHTILTFYMYTRTHMYEECLTID